MYCFSIQLGEVNRERRMYVKKILPLPHRGATARSRDINRWSSIGKKLWKSALASVEQKRGRKSFPIDQPKSLFYRPASLGFLSCASSLTPRAAVHRFPRRSTPRRSSQPFTTSHSTLNIPPPFPWRFTPFRFCGIPGCASHGQQHECLGQLHPYLDNCFPIKLGLNFRTFLPCPGIDHGSSQTDTHAYLGVA